MKRQLIIIFTISLATALLLSFNFVNALTISPPLLEIIANLGEKIEEEIKVICDPGEEGISFFPSLANFGARGEGGEPEFFEEERPYSLASWIKIDRSPIVFSEKKKRINVPFTIDVPEEAEPGGHYGVIFFSREPEVRKEAVSLGIGGKLGTLILVKVTGEIKEEGKLIEFNTEDGKSFYNRLPVNFIVRFENTGNVHLKPRGKIEIKNVFERIKETLLVNEENKNVLPESIRKFTLTWKKGDSGLLQEVPGIFLTRFFFELKKEKRNFAFGRYVALLTLEGYGTKEKMLWIIPWRLFSFCLVCLIVILLVMKKLIGAYNKWLIKKYGK